MTTAQDHADIVLAAIIPDGGKLLEIAQRHLTPDHFTERTRRGLWLILERYAEVTGGAVVTRQAVQDALGQNHYDAGTIALYTETYDLLADADADEAAFRWSLDRLRDLAAERATGEAITGGMEILTRGVQDEAGELVRGHVEARNHVLGKFAEIDRSLAMQDAPEGNMRVEGREMLTDYAEREALRLSGHYTGIEYGIPVLDEKVNGLQPGELVLLVGFTNEGKTHLVVQLAWNAAVVQGRNVVLLTTETVRNQVRRRLLARHSCLPGFNIDGGNGINSRAIKNGTLTDSGKRQLATVVDDFTRNPGYGTVWISQVPAMASMGYVETKCARLNRQFPVDLIILDYLALLRADRKRNTDREEYANNLKRAKQLATTFNDGNGVPFASPWQVSRPARVEAEKVGYYTSSAVTSETAEASNTPDQIISLLAPLDNEARVAPVRLQVMKHRDGERANSLHVSVDYATSRFFGEDTPTRSALDVAIIGLD
jgi:hypothetical protein